MPPRLPISLRRPHPSLTPLNRRLLSSSLAKITLVGRLAAEPELVATSTGRDMVRYSLGTTHGNKDNPQTSWWRVASFAEGGQRDYLCGLGKGTLVYLEGEASMRKFERDGKVESALSIIQQRIEVLKRPDTQHAAELEDDSTSQPARLTRAKEVWYGLIIPIEPELVAMEMMIGLVSER